jgi:DNA-directed RNA polymerase specialized sigma24 family protein
MTPVYEYCAQREAARFLKKYPVATRGRHDEVNQIARLAAWQAEGIFTGGRIIPFIRQRTRWALFTWMGELHPLKRGAARAGVPVPEHVQFNDVNLTTFQTHHDLFLRKQLRLALLRLPRTQRLAVVGTVLGDLPAAHIAKRLGLTRQAITFARGRGLVALRRSLSAVAG